MSKKKYFINGVRVYPDSPDLKNCKSLEDVQKLEIFSHMNDVAKKSSEEWLWNLCSKLKADPAYDGDGRPEEQKEPASPADKEPE